MKARAADGSDAILDRLAALHPKKIDLSLGRVEDLLERLGRPQDRLPPVIHVAGTNGKGSTVAFMRAILEAAGRRVHVYTSPHLVRFHERIRLGAPGGGRLVDEARLAATLESCERVNDGAPITLFEMTTAAALALFADAPADVLLLEVGLGGRFDATNVVARPLATCVTPVSMDHVEFLGDTVEKIAREKAGIFKRGCPALVGVQSDAALDVLEREAHRAGAPFRAAGRDFTAREEHGRLLFEDDDGLMDLPLPPSSRTPPAQQRRAGDRHPAPRAGRRARPRRDRARPAGRGMAGAAAAPVEGPGGGDGAGRRRPVARRRPQRGLRPRARPSDG